MLWQLVQGSLPPGIQLDETSGLLLGTPRSTGDFRFILAATDSGTPRLLARGEFELKINPALTIIWNPVPSVQSESISGELAVSNNLDESLDLTVIVVAINESGKAFVLGYQHFALAPRTSNLAIPFASSLPFGSYLVHADAIGEGREYEFHLSRPLGLLRRLNGCGFRVDVSRSRHSPTDCHPVQT